MGCSSSLTETFEIMTDVKSKFDLAGIELTNAENHYIMIVNDIDYWNQDSASLRCIASDIDKYVIKKYPSTDSLDYRTYHFKGLGDALELNYKFD